MRSIGDIQQRNAHLQAQLDFFRREKQDDGSREADTVAEFRPFSTEVEAAMILDNMKTLVLESYSGDLDPKDHLLYFNTKMVISAASDAVKCRMFPSTFKSTAMAWFTTLPRGSISNFRDFSSKFLGQFSANKVQQVTINDLYNIRQQEGESLKKLMARYSTTSMKVEDVETRSCALTFKNGLLPGKLNSKLSRKPAQSMAEVRARASTYIQDEEDDAFKRKRAKIEKDGMSVKHSRKDRYGGERGDGNRRKEEKAKTTVKPTRKQLYPPREDYERRRPWLSQGYQRREEMDMVLNTRSEGAKGQA
ncbi:uncharacterized protein LOC130748554 [Lotus japonicus]|uniref:uncharacterized protein LOC130748554 n=1 Tax=Lotus japonicus TaxID=34305 RepID=UPI00258C1935|nr:uncharacterized protein LOC130748554 [Lotus japonicus]